MGKNNRTTLSAFDINSGEIQWAIDGNFGDLFNSMVKIKDNILIPGDGYLFVINCQNGKILWKKEYLLNLGYQMEYDRDANLVYCSVRNFHRNNLSIIDPDSGELMNEFNFYEIGNLGIANGKVIAQVEMNNSDKGSLVCIDLIKKEVLWTIKGVRWSNAIPKPVIDQGTCYVFSFDNLIAVNISTGKIRWKIKYGKSAKYNLSWLPLNIIDHQVYWPDLNTPYIYKLDPKTGRTIQRIDLTHPIHSAFAYENGVIYYRSKNVLYAEKVDLK